MRKRKEKKKENQNTATAMLDVFALAGTPVLPIPFLPANIIAFRAG